MNADFHERREIMVRRQIEGRGIRDTSLVAAMRRVPREKFVPRTLAEFAYDDSPLPIDEGQTISQPYIVALMAEALDLEPGDRVLEIGTGSGYAAAVLAEIAGEVYTIERHAGLAHLAEQRLSELGYPNVHVRCGDGTRGWPEQAPFDAVVVTAGGPIVPESLREQLAVGGRLVIPVGSGKTLQTLLRVTRRGESDYASENLGMVRFVPLIGEQGWQNGHSSRRDADADSDSDGAHSHSASGAHGEARGDDDGRSAKTHGGKRSRKGKPSADEAPLNAAEHVARDAEVFDDYRDADLAPLLRRIGDARVILLGEASHGTAEFYEMRARITRALIERAGVRIVAVEADWPDARQIDRFVREGRPDPHPERAFTRFPSWMWANRQVLDFVRWLRACNSGRTTAEQVGFYGLDLYSLYTSIRAVLAYLDETDSEAAAVARARYGCLEPWENDPAAYGAAALSPRFEGCAGDVVRMMEDLLRRRIEYEAEDPERFFDAERNAALIKQAEAYYRAMYYRSHESWNLRDRHMYETLLSLLRHRGDDARAVVWAHNSHLGNAAATSMSARGETNLGELCRQAFKERCYAIGFGTDHGTVAAADHWDAPMRIMDVRPAEKGSYERVCHETGFKSFMLPLRGGRRAAHASSAPESSAASAREALLPERLERAIGVIYRPQTELASHYFHASLPLQFDEWIWFDRSRAVEPLPVPTDPHKTPDTFPFGL